MNIGKLKFQPIIAVNTKEFNAVLQECVRQSSRSAVDAINGRLLAVMLKAIKWTKKADKDEIAHTLGQVGSTLLYTKGSKNVPKRLRSAKQQRKFSRGRLIMREDSFAARIVNARRRDYAGPDYMLHGNALEAAAQRLIATRRRSVAFIKSGWLGAIRSLLPFIKFRADKKSPDADARIVGSPKGHSLPAKQGASRAALIEAIGVNTALVASGGKFQAPGKHDPMSVAMEGLRMAMREEKAEMERHLKQKLMESMKKAGATVRA